MTTIEPLTYKSNIFIGLLFVFLASALIFLPIWIVLVLLSITVYFSSGNIKFLALIVLILASALFNSNVDISGDISNYKIIYLDVIHSGYVDEFLTEPLLMLFYSVLGFFDADFRFVLFTQSLFINICLVIIVHRHFGWRGIKYYPIIILYPIYIQQGLYLSRQSLSIVFFMLLVTQPKSELFPRVKSTIYSLLSVLAHSISILYIFVFYISNFIKNRVKVRWILLFYFAVIFFPLNSEIINQIVNLAKNFAPSIDRKIGFYLNNNLSNSSLTLYSLILIPLHMSFILLLYSMMSRYKRPLDSISLFFIVFYFLILFFREYGILPERISMIVVFLAPLFFYHISNIILKSEYKNISMFIETVFFIFIIFVFIRFVVLNDLGDYNITFFNKESLFYNVVSWMVS